MVYSTAIGVFRLLVGAGKVLAVMDEQIIALYKKYGNCREVSEQLGINAETVRRVLIKHGIPRTSGKKRQPQKYKRPRVVIPIDEVIRLYQEGKSTIELGRLYDCHQNTILRKLKQAGIETRPQGKVKVELDMDEVQRLRENGESMEEIARRFGTTKAVVVKRCVKNGIVYGKGQSPANKRANHDTERKRYVSVRPIKKREQEFIEKFNKTKVAERFEYVCGYKGKTENLKIRCKKCGEISETTPHCIFDSRRANRVCVNCERIAKEQKEASRKAEKAKREAEEFAKDKTCRVCGGVFHSQYENAVYCSNKCKNKVKRRKDSSHRERARRYGVEYDSSITWQSLSKELGHCNCQICGEPCDPNDTSWNGSFGPLYPTVDCIVAMKNGGGYVRGNVQLAHAICNSVKRDLDNYEDISRAVSRHATNGGRNQKREQAQTTQNIGSSNRRVDRRRGRIAQHGPACATISRDNTRDCRTRSGVR